MTNLKKTLAVVLAFAMILSMGAVSTFAAYSDVTAGTVVSEAVDILSGLNILTGFEDGTFKPEETVTRAQMAAIICRTLGYEDQAKSSMGSTVFNDVAADHWASGYVNVAQAQQIINGYGDGNFGPEDKVTYEQAVKMIVSALGYDIAAQAKGGYPTGYLAIASAEGITKNANGKVGDAAVRGTIAVLVYNSLEVRLMDQNSWSTDGTDTYGKDNKNILTNYLDVVKVEGIVMGNALTGVVDEGTYDPDKKAKVAIDGYGWIFSEANAQGYSAYNKKALKDVNALDGENVFDASLVDATNLLGKYVIAYVGEDEVTGDNTVFAIAESKNRNDVIKINANQLVEDGKYYNAENVIGYTEVGSTRAKDLSLQKYTAGVAGVSADIPSVKVYRNYASQDTDYYDATYPVNTTAELAGLAGVGGIIEFVSNDSDDEIEYILVTAYRDEAVIENVEVNGSEYSFECYGAGSIDKIDTEDEKSYVAIYKDGVLATAADLAANDTVSHIQVAKKFDVYYVSSATVTGVVESYDPEEDLVTIAGVDYELSANCSTTADKLMGEEGIFFINVDGQIAHNETAPTAVGKYALITAVYDETSGVKAGSYAQVVLADGTVAEYEISKTADVVNANKVTQLVDNTDVYFKAYFASMLTNVTKDHDNNPGTPEQPTSTYKAKVANFQVIDDDPLSPTYNQVVDGVPANLIVKLTVSNDKITKATLLEGTPSYYKSGSKYDADAYTIKNRSIDDSTVVFSVQSPKTLGDFVDPDDIVVGTIADNFVDGEDYANISIYDRDTNSAIYGALLGIDIKKAVDKLSSVFVVTSKRDTTYDDGDAYVVTGVQNGEEAKYTIYNEKGYGTEEPWDLAVGDVLLISEATADGVVAEYQQLVDFNKNYGAATTTARTAGLTDDDDEIFSGFGALTAGEKRGFTIDAAVTDDYTPYGTEVAAGNSIGYTNVATYTLVDFTENAKKPEVTKEAASKYLFDTDYETYVYVRYVEGKLADVVVYRMSEIDGVLTGRVEKTGLVDNPSTIKYGANMPGATATAAATDGTTAIFTDNGDGTFTLSGTAGDEVEVTITITDEAGYEEKALVVEYELD